ncbi:TPA: helix-turn-helix transcriptional regulator [Enterobacter bugandensis]|nr:hypothetical protein [Kosakonia phage Kc166B]HDT4050889.1 helix-turn-helix transcriptional regulator [Enterobacter bugandensis]
MAITTRIKAVRESTGVTQRYISEQSGVDVHQLSRYENGHQIPSVESLQRIAQALGVPMEDLIVNE